VPLPALHGSNRPCCHRSKGQIVHASGNTWLAATHYIPPHPTPKQTGMYITACHQRVKTPSHDHQAQGYLLAAQQVL
jgi:hypothetical protein